MNMIATYTSIITTILHTTNTHTQPKMAPYFHGGERLQRGRGIGGLLRIASSLFRPLGSVTAKALKSAAGKKIINAVKKAL